MKTSIHFYTRKTRATVVLSFVLMSLPTWLTGQNRPDTIAAYFGVLDKIPQEKVYLHIDKPYYGAGESIWMKGYLLDGLTHKEDAKSNFIITELINRSDSVLQRKKIRRDSICGFQNAFTLPPTLPAGEYYLRAYTNWMQNTGADFFFSRNLSIGNAIDNSVFTHVSYQPGEKNSYTVQIKFTNSNAGPYPGVNIRYLYFEEGKLRDKGRKKTDENGLLHIPLSEVKDSGNRRLEIEFDDPLYVFQKTFHLPIFSKDFELTFFPEGGSFMAVNHQTVAFKVQAADGFSRSVHGHLFNAKGDTIVEFKSAHNGMGRLPMRPVYGEKHYVMATSSDGVTKRFDLPMIEKKGINISVNHHRQEIRYEIQKTDSTQWPEELYLLAHTRGKLVLLKTVSKESPYGIIKDESLSPGITSFLLVDNSGRPVSERLVFIQDKKEPSWQIETDRKIYDKREKVSMQIIAKDDEGKPLSGNFSISITDRSRVKLDSLAENITSSFLLTSDLKGYIETPGYYFITQDVQTTDALDLLMLTHGWRRHKIENVLRPIQVDIKHFIEAGQTISGKVKGFFGAGVKSGEICVLAPQKNIFMSTNTDENGQFLFDLAFTDSTQFAVQARTKRGFAGVDILLDKPEIPKAVYKNPFANVFTPPMDDYLISTRDQYYMEGGIRVYNLKEVVVTAKRKDIKTSMYAGANDYVLSGEQLTRPGSNTLLDIIRFLPGVNVKNGNEPFLRNNSEPMLIAIDDIPYEDQYTILADIAPSFVESITLFRDASSANFFGQKGASGVIAIALKDPSKMPRTPPRGIVTYTPLGYSDAVEFYHPKYDTPEKKENGQSDLRTTIYWNPALKLDASGVANIEYYTPDSTAPEDIVIEGVDQHGKICRYVTTMNQK